MSYEENLRGTKWNGNWWISFLCVNQTGFWREGVVLWSLTALWGVEKPTSGADVASGRHWKALLGGVLLPIFSPCFYNSFLPPAKLYLSESFWDSNGKLWNNKTKTSLGFSYYISSICWCFLIPDLRYIPGITSTYSWGNRGEEVMSKTEKIRGIKMLHILNSL